MPKLSENEVRTVILDLKNSAAGWDNFPTFVAKKCIDGYLTPLTKIINKSISQGIFPSELKLARVIPIIPLPYQMINKMFPTIGRFRS